MGAQRTLRQGTGPRAFTERRTCRKRGNCCFAASVAHLTFLERPRTGEVRVCAALSSFGVCGRRNPVFLLRQFGFFAGFFFLSFVLLGPHPQHMEVPRLGVELELQLPPYTTATATWDPSCVCDLHHSSWQRWIVNPLSKGRDRTRNLMVPSRIR